MSRELRFPDAFWWGSATSSHQVEGDNRNNDWWAWEMKPGAIHDGTRSGDAAGWWSGRAESDLDQARAWGHNAHRMSLEWSRLEPTPGVFDDEAFERYRQILGKARALGLKVIVTINHFTLPMWAAKRGSWLWPELPERFARLCKQCAERLGDRVSRWATLNEPNVLAFMAYAGREWPPGLGDAKSFGRAARAMLEAHARGAAEVRRSRPGSPVGLVLNLPVFDPSRRHPGDLASAKAQDWAFNGAILHALTTGQLLFPLSLRPRPLEGLASSCDWIGLNYYGRFSVRFDPRRPGDAFGRHDQTDTVRTEWTDWGQPHPQGLIRGLRRLSRLRVPMFVTENGTWDAQDTRRPEFLRSHLRALHRACGEGLDVRGYFHWSLVDNFEWAEGWATRFGLLALDRDTQERTPRPSAEIYAEICRSGMLLDE